MPNDNVSPTVASAAAMAHTTSTRPKCRRPWAVGCMPYCASLMELRLLQLHELKFAIACTGNTLVILVAQKCVFNKWTGGVSVVTATSREWGWKCRTLLPRARAIRAYSPATGTTKYRRRSRTARAVSPTRLLRHAKGVCLSAFINGRPYVLPRISSQDCSAASQSFAVYPGGPPRDPGASAAREPHP